MTNTLCNICGNLAIKKICGDCRTGLEFIAHNLYRNAAVVDLEQIWAVENGEVTSLRFYLAAHSKRDVPISLACIAHTLIQLKLQR